MIPVSTLYDEYIDRPKLTEQKKTHMNPPPSRGVGTKQLGATVVNLFVFADKYDSSMCYSVSTEGTNNIRKLI